LKKLLTLLISLLFIFASCGKGSENIRSSSENSQSRTKTDEIVVPVSKDLALSSYEGCMTADGFYYLKTVEDNEDTGESHTLIMHLNAPSMLEIPLCNKPECKHMDDSCNAFVGGSVHGIGSSVIFTDGNKLYLIIVTEDANATRNFYSKNSSPDVIVSDEITVFKGSYGLSQATSIQALYSMNLDGTNHTKLIEFDSGITIDTPLAIGGGKIYCIKDKIEVTGQGDGATSIGTSGNSELICIDIAKKTVTSLTKTKDKTIIGAYKTLILFEENHSDVDPDTLNSANDSDFLKYYNNMDRMIISLDTETAEEKTLLKGKTVELEMPQTDGNIMCYSDRKSKKFKCLNLDTGENTEILIANKKNGPYLNKVMDGKLIYYYDDGKNVNAQMDSFFCYDFETRESTELKLFIKSGEKFSVDIIDKIGDSYLVIPKHDEEKENTWAGTIQYNILRRYYALIKQDDYWNSKPNYKYFEE